MQHKKKYKITSTADVAWMLRCLTATKLIVATRKKNSILFSLSPDQLKREKMRQFAATIAIELSSLSERVRTIITHAPSVGTYRENILQNSLKKHLPERYHVATGFILGLDRQIDILIYDRIDYAPIFRDGDLAIVSPESVRAVIEVKTTLTERNLESALDLLDETSSLDNNYPPFFKGIFSFESRIKSETLYKKIANFYTDYHTQSQGGPGKLICRPFQHLTCICVNKKSFAYTSYIKNKKNRLVPALYSKNSATELESQTSFFMESLLSHLKFGGMKPFKKNHTKEMLGEDTFRIFIKDLREGDDSWGAYFLLDEREAEQEDVKEMESLIFSVQNWLDGEENFEN